VQAAAVTAGAGGPGSGVGVATTTSAVGQVVNTPPDQEGGAQPSATRELALSLALPWTRAGVPPDLPELISQCTAPDPARRPNAAAVALRLAAVDALLRGQVRRWGGGVQQAWHGFEPVEGGGIQAHSVARLQTLITRMKGAGLDCHSLAQLLPDAATEHGASLATA
jgi:hypothetical protein